MGILPLTGGGDVFGAARPAGCATGRCVPLLADRDLTGTGVEVDLLGETAPVAAGPAVARARTGAALLPVIDPLRAAARRRPVPLAAWSSGSTTRSRRPRRDDPRAASQR